MDQDIDDGQEPEKKMKIDDIIISGHKVFVSDRAGALKHIEMVTDERPLTRMSLDLLPDEAAEVAGWLTQNNNTHLLGKQVEITLESEVGDRKPIIARGKLLAWCDGGEAQLLDEMGFVHHCWPMLRCEAVDED